MADYSYAKTKYVASLDSARHVSQMLGYDGDIEVAWKLPNAANPAYVAPVPADNHKDLQTFFFGAMSHSLTVRPHNPERGCCASSAYKFDIATDMFGPAIGTGEISNGCCQNEVSVTLPSGALHGEIRNACCSLQPRINLDWSTGENMSLRMPTGATCCGPFRTGFVGTAPGEEDDHKIRYWDTNGMYLTCNLFLCLLPCRIFCIQMTKCCVCVDEIGFTTWHPLSLASMRSKLLGEFGFKLRSSFGIPAFELNSENLPIGVNNTEHLSDINALGHQRIRMHKAGCCCNFIMTDPANSKSDDASSYTALDLSFRGTFNQNQLDPKDFNLALGYLILNTKFFLDQVRSGQPASMAAVRSLPGAMSLLHQADVRPNHAGINGNKMV